MSNLPVLTLKDAKNQIQIFLDLHLPIFLHGPVGLGKSSLINQIATEQKRKVIDLRMSQLDISDLRGIPYYNTDLRAMCWSPPVCLPQDPEDDSILFLDEFNCASPAIQASAYQLVLDRKVGDYTLPQKVSVVAAGNRDKDLGSTFKMSSPLLNRFVHLNLDYDFQTWLEWAFVNNIHPKVLSYLQQHKSDLTPQNWDSSQKAFATPRSWEYVSTYLHKMLSVEENIESIETLIPNLTAGIAACIGEALALKFVATVRDTSAIIDYTWKDLIDINSYNNLKMRVAAIPQQFQLISFLETMIKAALEDESAAKEFSKNKMVAVDTVFHFIQDVLQARVTAGKDKSLRRDLLLTFITTIKNIAKEKLPLHDMPHLNTFLDSMS